ncbi:ABC transporter permease [Fructobacillus parabroussonetiae]|uniref:ABC transporter permease n=1 Tax=Fructobacillus parabroussonetiae TaxID=2713174 RepID=A0ABS5QYD8_9LACO|nr:ABC transporter permease [Fructobacillus parabroussonetiae]MBS9336912.1 ABC transporter permease [Fructobacillus parabroussonetiae]
MFYFKLAFDSLRKNKESYLPFLLASTAAIAMNFLLQLLIYAPGVKDLMMADVVRLLLVLGQVVIGLLSLVILIYSYSFLRKGKQKEFGLYSILGMTKKDLLKISFIQQLLTFIISLIAGLLSGFVFAKGMILLLMKLIHGASFKMTLATPALVFTILFFAAAFLVLTIVDATAVYRSKTVDLMKADKKVAQQPKNRWLLFLLGLVALFIGYGLSLTVPTPVKAVKQFFVAALLIIEATYLLFMAASTLILKGLQKRERYYYQSQHFISVSNMLFRMKQNAVGLASITLLATMTLVVALTTASMFFGKANLTQDMFPRNTIVTTQTQKLSAKSIQSAADKTKVHVSKLYSTETSAAFYATINQKGSLTATVPNDSTSLREVRLMDEENYQKLTGTTLHLKDKEVLVYQGAGKNKSDSKILAKKKLTLNQETYTVKDTVSTLKNYPKASNSIYPNLIIVTANGQAYQDLTKAYATTQSIANSDDTDSSEARQSTTRQQFFFNLTGQNSRQDDFLGELTKQTDDNLNIQEKSIVAKLSNALYGGFFFIGILFSLSFILATGLMIYYKQISEGKADQAQFEILQKVGMSTKEIKKTIRSQIVWLFGLPIAVSVAHLGFAFPMIQKLLLAFAIPMSQAVYLIMALTILAMVLIYFIIYKITSRTYFKQVTNWQD